MKATLLAALGLVALGTLRICSTYTVFNHTIDEPDHLAAGMEWLHTGKYRYEDQHPPLARVFGAIGPSLAGETWRGGPDSYLEGYRILGHGAHYDRILAFGRAGILPFFWGASLVVCLWGYRLAGPVAAISATLFFTTLPPILAHGGLITTDLALTCWVGAAGLVSLYWAESPGRARSLLLGAVIGLAVLSKFSALVFLPAGWMAMWAVSRRNPKAPRDYVRAAGLVAAVAVLVVWAGYQFSFARVEFLHMRLPAPRFFSGIHAVWEHNRAGHPSYLLGKRSLEGFWYYFPVVLAIKSPLAMLCAVLATIAVQFRRAAVPLAFSAAILLAALPSRIDIGIRHILPVYIGLAVAAGLLVRWAWDRGWLAKAVVAALVLWQMASGALQHPDYLAYTNEIAGTHPERFVADSDLDWGQDMKRLEVFLMQSGAPRVTFSPFNRTYALAGGPMIPMSPGDNDHPSSGWNAVSITVWKVFGFPAWADRTPPQKRIGRSILLWYVSDPRP